MRHHGRATISYDGKRLAPKPGATLNLGGVSRTAEPLTTAAWALPKPPPPRS